MIGKIGDLFGKNDVSIESIVQLDASENKAEIVVITHEVSNGKFEKSKKEINALSEVELIASQLSCIWKKHLHITLYLVKPERGNVFI